MRELKIGDFWAALLRLAVKKNLCDFHSFGLYEILFNKQ